MWTTAEAIGAASTSPSIPKTQPAPIVSTSTASGWRSSAEPIANGWTMFCSSPLARITTTSMISAVVVPFAPSAIRTAKAPATNAPDVRDVGGHEGDDRDRAGQRHAEHERGEATTRRR